MARPPDDAASIPADPADVAREERRRRQGRLIVLVYAWVKTGAAVAALLFLTTVNAGQDPAGRGIVGGLFGMLVLYWLVFVLPALLLAHKGRLIGFCFALLVVPDLLAVLAATML